METKFLGYIIATFLLHFVIQSRSVSVTLESGGRLVDKEVVEGTSPELVCHYRLTNKSGPKRITWKYEPASDPKSNTILVFNTVPSRHNTTVELTGIKANIRLLNVTRTQNGVYICTVVAINDSPSSSSGSYNVSVIVPPAKPVCRFRSLRVRIGSSTSFTCFSNDGIPPPKYSWIKDSFRLPSNSSHDFRTVNMSYIYNETTGTIRFLKFNRYNEGNYTCKAYNRAGEKHCFHTYIEAFSNAKRLESAYIVVVLVSVMYLVVNPT